MIIQGFSQKNCNLKIGKTIAIFNSLIRRRFSLLCQWVPIGFSKGAVIWKNFYVYKL